MAPDTVLGIPADIVRGLAWITVLAAAGVFVVASIVRAVTYARLPVHLRWELYPVPHEPPRRARYGGSAFEETDWWLRPRVHHHANAAWAMAREILVLHGLWHANRPLWYRSYPFHLGLYLVVAAAGALLVGALGWLVAPGVTASAIGPLSTAGEAIGTLGLALAVVGAAGLLRRRLTDPALLPYTTTADRFNLAAFVVAFGCLLGGVLAGGGERVGGVAVARAILTVDTAVAVSAPVVAGVTLSALLAAYIPFTHMAHFVAKFFTYHLVRWDDRPGDSGRIERSVARLLAEHPTWSAPHVGADGSRTWADIATTGPAERRS